MDPCGFKTMDTISIKSGKQKQNKTGTDNVDIYACAQIKCGHICCG